MSCLNCDLTITVISIPDYYCLATTGGNAGTLTSFRALRRLLVEDIGEATFFIRIEWEISFIAKVLGNLVWDE